MLHLNGKTVKRKIDQRYLVSSGHGLKLTALEYGSFLRRARRHESVWSNKQQQDLCQEFKESVIVVLGVIFSGEIL